MIYTALAIFLFLSASLHAKLEIEIEGRHGWAEKLPTRHFRFALMRYFSEHGYVTGFHLYTILFVFTLMHFPVFFVEQWSLNMELFVLGFFLLHVTLEDFLWFMYNPAFGLKRFSPKYIWWHKHWFLGVPISYWLGVPVGLLLLFVIRL